VIESVPFSIDAVGVMVTVAVVDVSVRGSGSTTQLTFGSDVVHDMFATPPLGITKFVPVTPIVNPEDPAVRFPTAVTAVTVGPATIAMVPV
jgi:hypothetical protein